ncbi:MAG: hypothetical protein LIQ31_02365, partial [Planctomycetes bacterium]|nr:hypothetical protein [Planctomycetota bacterium]
GDRASVLGRQAASPRGSDLKTILSDVADQAGVAIMLVTPPAEMVKPLPGDIDRYTFGRVTEVLARERGLGKRVFLADGGVVFEPGRTARSRRTGGAASFFGKGWPWPDFQFGRRYSVTAAPPP